MVVNIKLYHHLPYCIKLPSRSILQVKLTSYELIKLFPHIQPCTHGMEIKTTEKPMSLRVVRICFSNPSFSHPRTLDLMI